MVIDDFNATCLTVRKDEADAPLVIYAYAPLTIAIAAQFFQTVVWRNPQVVEAVRIIQHPQLAPRYGLNLVGQFSRELALPDGTRRIVMKAAYHGGMLSHRDSTVKRGMYWESIGEFNFPSRLAPQPPPP